MQKIKDIEVVVAQLKPLLRTYLEDNDTEFRGTLFTCPNRAIHNNGDRKPSAGFIPDTDETVWHCFSCSESGNIFNAYGFIEERDTHGANWYVAVRALADRYKIPYELETLKPEEQEQANVQEFLQAVVSLANSNLLNSKDSLAWKYLKDRQWDEVVDYFNIGYLQENDITRKFFKDWFGSHPEINRYIALSPENLYNRIIYPVKHKYGVILGLITRSLEHNPLECKYRKHFLGNLEKGGVLFNLTKNYKTIYLVEGASSVFTLYKYGVKNVVGLLGKAFTQNMYNSLVKEGIDRVIFVYDGDIPGQRGLENALTLTQDKSDIKILVKILTDNKDPDDIVREYGVDYFKNIPEISNFRFQLLKLKDNRDESKYEILKKSVFDIMAYCQDSLIKDKMMKMFVNELDVSKSSLNDELDKYKLNKGVVSDVSVADILNEETHLLDNIERFEEASLNCSALKGVSTGFPLLDRGLDGLQTGLILVAGKWNVGKTSFLQTLGLNLLKDASNYVLYFSIDDPAVPTTIPRLVSNLSTISTNSVANPIYQIDQNTTLDMAEKLILKQRREEAINLLKQYSSRLGIKDASDGYDTEYLERIIKIYRAIAKDRKLIVLVDFFNMVEWKKKAERTEIETQLAFFFKQMSGKYDCPIVCTVEANKGIADSKIQESDIKGSSALQFRSTLTLLLSSSFEADESSEMFFYDEKDIPQPVVKLKVAKNKGSSFRKSLYYKFYRESGRYVECTEEEQKEYARKF